ncbi:NTPase [Lunatimonas lonarensis]|uniref:NTPase n=1 Tax=Lunatimonas lonarensis TaxID=1232681 RepID=R7ZW98_9BACT|nr:hypothetical protein [Lunatimonas lonarensis]EON78416.1 NTPase [Lunatimonas lonarensis]
MKYILAFGFACSVMLSSLAQESVVNSFLDGKSVILISASQAVEPVYSWQEIANEIHAALVAAGGDPVAYYELEDVVLTEGNQRAYAEAFSRRLIRNVGVITRPANGNFHIHLAPFSQDQALVRPGQGLSAQANDLSSFKTTILNLIGNQPSSNFLVLDVPEFPTPPTGGTGATTASYFQQAPLNLNVFRLGVLLSGAAGDEGYLNTFRQDLFGKTPQQLQAEQLEERQGLERIFGDNYPYEVAFLTESSSNQQLIQNRIQFMLMRIEGRETDIMRTMGVSVPSDRDTNRIVVKFYIKLLVRNELYIGAEWDADPDWRKALANFLSQISG